MQGPPRLVVLAAAAAAAAILLSSAAAQPASDPGAAGAAAEVDPSTSPSIVEVFGEDWDAAGSVEDAGWENVTLDGPGGWRQVHEADDDPGPGVTIPTSSSPHAVTVMEPDGTYPPGLSARLASPVLDLRYVRGASTATDTPYRHDATAPLLGDLHDVYQDELGPSPLLGPYGYLLQEPPSDWTPIPCPERSLFGPCPILADPPHRDESGGDAYEDGTLTQRIGVRVANPFTRGDLYSAEETVEAPLPGPREVGLYADEDGDVHTPNPLDRREGAAHVNLTFWHRWDLAPGDAAYLEVRELRPDRTWSDWRHLDPDTADATGDPLVGVRGDAGNHNVPPRGGYNGWDNGRRAFVGSSDGLVATSFNLSRFAGERIQLAWRLPDRSPCATCTADAPGWFVDDVSVDADTYARDVGVRRIDRPDPGDVVAPDDPFRPSATVRNYGHQAVDDVRVAFQVTPRDDPDEVLHESTRKLASLDAQEEVQVTAPRAVDLPSSGDYQVAVEVTPWVPDAQDPSAPQTTPHDDNDRRSIPLRAEPVPEADVDVQVPPGSRQTDVGVPKDVTVGLDNDGNTPLSGTLTLTATRIDPASLEPVGTPQVVATADVPRLPYGDDLNAFGADDDTWTADITWSQGLDPAGVYRLEATLEADRGTFDGHTSTFVRATPPSAYEEDLEDPRDGPFDERSVYSFAMEEEGWKGIFTNQADEGGNQPYVIAAEPTLPDPVSPNHAWYGRGDDGAVGTASHGNSLERTAGLDETLDLDDTYQATEPDSRHRTRDTNLVDHHWLTREVDLTDHGDADEVTLDFWHSASFQWSDRTTRDQRDPDHARGLVEVADQRNALLTDPRDDATPAGIDQPDAETGLDPVDGRTPDPGDLRLVPGEAVYAEPIAAFEAEFPWTRTTLDLTPWKGQHVTLRFHLETTAERTKVNASDAGALQPWLLDDVEVTARRDGDAETVVSTDLEGDDWRRWSTRDGVQVDDPREPVAVAEGRGWERHSYGADVHPSGWHVDPDRTRPEAGEEVQTATLRWGNPTSAQEALPEDVNFSVLRTPTFTLEDTRDPQLSFLTKYDFPASRAWAQTQYNHWTRERTDRDHVTSGGSVWLVAEDQDGDIVRRELLTPAGESDAQYRGTVASWYSGEATCREGDNDVPGNDEIHCTTPLRRYPERPNVLTGASGQALDDGQDPRWTRAAFDLSPHLEPGNDSLRYRLEFHAINQRRDRTEGLGWLVDEIRVGEDTYANDLAVTAVETPGRGDPVGPGLEVPLEATVANRGLYAQAGAAVHARIVGPDGALVYDETVHTDPDDPIPGTRSGDPGARDVSLPNWTTPETEGQYRIAVEVALEDALDGHAFPDRNGTNDLRRRTVEVREIHDVAVAGPRSVPDVEVVAPWTAGPDRNRTFSIPVENQGTLPQSPTLEVNVTRDGATVFRDDVLVPDLAPRETREVTLPATWSPDAPGEHEVNLTVIPERENVPDPKADNTRRFPNVVPARVFPDPGDDPSDALVASDGNWTHADGAWRFGADGTYPNGTDSRLQANRTLDLRRLQRGLVRLEHAYAFEEAYDGGRVEVRPAGAGDWIPVPPRTEAGPAAPSRYPAEMASASPFTEDPADPARALSGSRPDGGQVYDLGQVDALTRRAVVFDDDLRRDDGDGFGSTPTDRRGDWTRAPVSQVEPHSGDVMFHSNHTLVERSCWRHESENTASSEGSLACSNSNPDSTYAGEYDSRKYLNLTFDDDFPSDREPLASRLADADVAALEVAFWDYRAVGLPELPRADSPEKFNGISLKLTCVGHPCPEDDTVVLDPAKSTGYDDNYRDWTRNEYRVPAERLEPLVGPDKAVRLSFVHHLTNDVGGETRTWSTDARSIHAGWFVDDVSVALVNGTGATTTYWSDDLEGYNRTYEPRTDSPYTPTDEVAAYCEEDEPRCAIQEVLNIGPWDGGSWTYQKNKEQEAWLDRPLWDPRSEWGERIWHHAAEGELPCGPLWDGESETAERVDYPDDLRADAPQFRACGPTREHRERAGGSRLVSDLNLRPAADDVTLTFEHRHRFREDDTHSRQEGIGKQGRSGGRLEVSVDGGDTWIPLEPLGEEPNHKSMYDFGDVTDNAHTTLGGRDGDPEGNSPYGMGGEAFTGISGAEPDDGPETQRATYDLSRFAGREVKVAWHAFFDTHNQTMVANEDQGHEFWAVENVTVEADVLDARQADLRLRAASDGTGVDDGWTVDHLQVLGVRRDVDAGTSIQGLPDDDPVEAGERSFAVALENGGTTDLQVDATVTAWEVGHTRDLVLNASEERIHLAAGERLERDSLGGQNLTLLLEGDHDYEVEARVTVPDPANRARERIRADNLDAVTLDEEDILEESTLRVADVRTRPNHVAGTPDDEVAVEAKVRNHGFETATVEDLTLTWTPVDGNATELRRTDANRSGATPLWFSEPFQTRTYTWTLDPAAIETLEGGVYDVAVEVLQHGKDEPRSRTGPAYVGPGYVPDVGYQQTVADAALDDAAHDECRTPAPATDRIDDRDWRTAKEPNRSEPRSFATGAFSGGDGAAQGGSPGRNPVKATLVCEVEDLEAMGEDLRLGFFTRWSFEAGNDESHYRVRFGTAPQDDDCRGGATLAQDLVESEGRRSRGWSDGAWVRQSFRIPDDLIDDAEGRKGCVTFDVYAYDEAVDGVHVDDVVVAPLEPAVGPDQQAPIPEETPKVLRVPVRNLGLFNASLDLALEDHLEREADGPPGWDVEVLADEPLALDPGAERRVPVRVTAPDGAADGDRARVGLAAESGLTPHVRDAAVLTLDPRP